ncbi:predicted protein [Nematostella vectensis]|uniref:G-protein coupled receptors family 1 profile domain-containing protein n=1 Tax=Nematostella vectensis TaxID=45351 RepID=A7S3I8_NEMVE|nr:dopamine D2-like receptor [Nematostella vectensis]EDO41733.1 predicted protein [Nematostella vectensis]|eukprot:XP_001633796.1 predicted protein [Nematostella vectensis]
MENSTEWILVAPGCLGLQGWKGFTYLNQGLVIGIVVLTIMVGVCGTVANTLVLMAVYRTVSLRTTTNLFLTSLAVSDLTMGCVIVPLFAFGAVNWPYHSRYPVFGMTVDFMLMQSLIASTYNLCVISFDRHVAVKDPLRYMSIMTKKRVITLIAITWFASVAFSVQSFTNANYEKRPKLYFIPSLVVPMPAVTFMMWCYWRIYKEAMRQKRRIQDHSPSVILDDEEPTTVQSNKSEKREKMRKERKATITVAIVIGTFLLCWLPNMIVSIVQFIYTSIDLCNAVMIGEFWLISLPISSINSVANPLIYVLRNNEFKHAVIGILRSKGGLRQIGWT